MVRNSGPKIKDIGEFALIERLADSLGKTGRGPGQGVIRGIGDDAAVLQATSGTRILAACDMMVEGKHFDLSYFTPQQIGWRALAVNLSDIAAMGGKPRWALVSLGLKPEMEVAFAEGIYAGIAELAQKHGVAIVGGDTCSSPNCMIIDICILGEAYRSQVTYRSGANPGDLILVTGNLGSAAAGLSCLSSEKQLQIEGKERLVETHLTPFPRVGEAAALIESGTITAMDDISDGLALELHEISQASGLGAQIYQERIPQDEAAVSLAAHLEVNPLDWALYGGEDLELLLTIPGGNGSPYKARRLARILKRTTGTSLTLIGRMMDQAGDVEMVDPQGKTLPLPAEGYNHFR